MRKNRSTILLGLAFVLLLGVYFATSYRPREVSKGAAPLIEGALPEIDRIEMISPAKLTITLERQSQGWVMTSPFSFAVDQEMVETLMSLVGEIMVDGTITSKKESFDDYAVGESTGTEFKLFSGGATVIDYYVGRHATDLGHCYARKPDGNEVELWRSMISQELLRPAEEWRDRTLYFISPMDIMTIEAVEGSSRRKLVFSDSTAVFTENGVVKPLPLSRARMVALYIAHLRSDLLPEPDEIPVAASDPDVRVTFTVRNGDRHVFDVWRYSGGVKRYLVRKENGDVLYSFYEENAPALVLIYDGLKEPTE